MATSGARPERVYHQDYIARIRYSNALPPPPNPPKLLDIPNTGLASGQYTSAGFAARLAREQPLNIEADAELGMPIDLIGLPGIFDGDESALQGPAVPPPIHPHDKALLRPLATLGKPASVTSGVSFLRRTEYISSGADRMRFESSTSKDLLRVRNNTRKRRKPDVAKDDPINIARSIVKGFDLAYPRDAYTGPDSDQNLLGAEVSPAEKDAWTHPRHPTKPDLKLLDSYPVLPHVESLPTTGNYNVIKYITNPVAASSTYDSRLDVAVLRPLELRPDQVQHYEDMTQANEEDPTKPVPSVMFDYELFLPESEESVAGIKRILDVNDQEKEDAELYDSELKYTKDQGAFCYRKVRTYETYQQVADSEEGYGDTVALALHDAEIDNHTTQAGHRLQKGAYYYPVRHRTFIRPKRAGRPRLGMDQTQRTDEQLDELRLLIKDPEGEELEKRATNAAYFEGQAEAEA
ncbi:hypothetical protein LTR04_006483 [Oleoguttula sp. CCFEE 6159]|nr:hypothetical protein LTR04_006483 [Oleoguttula sp. CCFEE 6159]